MRTSLRHLLSASALFAVFASASIPARAVTKNYCSFPPGLTDWTLNQNAFEALSSEFRLTSAIASEAGSAFLTAPFSIATSTSFHAHFRFQIGSSATGGDGVAFVLQNAAGGASAIGTSGAGMGYGGIGNSAIVEFDTFKNSSDPNANHVGLMLNGSTTHTAYASPAFTMAGGGKLDAWVDYDGVGKTIKVYVAQSTTKPATPVLSNALNLYAQLGSAGRMYVGFTAATGISPELNQHDVFELEFSTDGTPCTCEGDAACGGSTPACASSGICAICSATNAAACTGATPVCNVPTNSCVGCLTNANCSGATPICDKNTLTCRACTGGADCGGSTPVCDTTGPNAGKCVLCTADANCPPTAPRCSLTSNTCVQCLSGADCGGNTPVCNNGLCKACGSDADCSGATPACEVWGACGQCTSTNSTACTGATAVCDYPTGTCVGCEFNSDCSGSTPVCNTATHVCKACQTNADCNGNSAGPSCVTSGMKAGSCVACTSDVDCTSAGLSKCDTIANRCVACLSNADCGGSTPVCNAQNVCVACTSNADCGGATPICDTSSFQCKACQNDYSASNPGPSACPTAALPACQLAGTPLAGKCGQCSSLNASACVGNAATPFCQIAAATCGCSKDADCNADSYCDTSTVATGVCTPGCHVVAGMTNCTTGKYCTKTDGSVGTCMSQPCDQSSDCTAPNSVCNTIAQPHQCVQCLNDPDCPSGEFCDAMNHCVECAANRNCNGSPKGPVCLANETCGCASDADCGTAASNTICDATSHTCKTGCRGMGGNGCPPPLVCSSTDDTVGMCSTPTSTDAGTDASGDATIDDAGAATTSSSSSGGCSCRVHDDGGDTREGTWGVLLMALALGVRRARRTGTKTR